MLNSVVVVVRDARARATIDADVPSLLLATTATVRQLLPHIFPSPQAYVGFGSLTILFQTVGIIFI